MLRGVENSVATYLQYVKSDKGSLQTVFTVGFPVDKGRGLKALPLLSGG